MGGGLSLSPLALLRNSWFLACLGIAIVHFIVQKAGILIPFAHAYLDDLLCMPVVLGLALMGMRIVKGEPEYRLETRHVLIALVLFSVWFEWWLPQRSELYTGDPLDVLAYLVGAVFFWRFINPPAL